MKVWKLTVGIAEAIVATAAALAPARVASADVDTKASVKSVYILNRPLF
jgi:hypothetical protein